MSNDEGFEPLPPKSKESETIPTKANVMNNQSKKTNISHNQMLWLSATSILELQLIRSFVGNIDSYSAILHKKTYPPARG